MISYSYTAFATNTIVNGVLKGMEAGVAAIIVDLVITMFQQLARKSQPFLLVIPVITFILNYFFNIHPILLIILTILMLLFIFRDLGGDK
ncbi:MAG: chromate transporter [Enterococcus sp.]